MQGNSFNNCGNGCCPCRGNGGGRLRRVTLPATDQPSLITPQFLTTERRICCTDRLVRIYNNTADGRERKVLGHWLSLFVDVFDDSKSRQKAEGAEELAHLANVNVLCPFDKELVLRVLNALCEAMSDDTRTTQAVVKALSYALASLDVTVLDGDPTKLLQLADTLTRILQDCIAQTRPTFKRYRPVLVALYQACTVVHRIAPGLPACNRLKEYQDDLLRGLKVVRDSPYYPYRFFGKLIEQGIQRFTEGNDTPVLFDIIQRMGMGTAGVLDMRRGVCHLNPSAISEGIRRLKAACADDKLRRKLWFDWLQTLSSAAMLCLTDPEKFQLLQSCLEHILEYQRKVRDREERKAMRFGIVNELTSLATLAECHKVREEAMFEFQHLATRYALGEGWDVDPEIYEGLLDAAAKIYQQGEFCEHMVPVLTMLTSSTRFHLRQTIHAWFENKTLDDKLRSLLEGEEDLPSVCHRLLLQRVAEIEMPSSRNDFWPNGTITDDGSSAAANAVLQVCFS